VIQKLVSKREFGVGEDVPVPEIEKIKNFHHILLFILFI
jgi:hypothetical protein